MFFTFLNKEDTNCIDSSVMMKYPPEDVLFYYYNSHIELSLNTYTTFSEYCSEKDHSNSNIYEWINFIDDTLKAKEDLVLLAENDYLDYIGPYYYPETNTRVYFNKQSVEESQAITAEDLDTIWALNNTPEANMEIHQYNKNKKSTKKTTKNTNELIKDIEMCLISLKEIEKINKHINYLNKLLDKRYNIIEQDSLFPLEPDNIPLKPEKTAEIIEQKKGFLNLTRFKQKPVTKDAIHFNHDMKVYIIRYREYEKACDRYKEALDNWKDVEEIFRDNCLSDILDAEAKLKSANKTLQVYNSILKKSYVHIDYQDIQTLNIFKQYLETGRADDIQDCMNLFEDEKHWSEIKLSQTRIENTIYLLQNDNQYLQLADGKINELVNKINKKVLVEA